MNFITSSHEFSIIDWYHNDLIQWTDLSADELLKSVNYYTEFMVYFKNNYFKNDNWKKTKEKSQDQLETHWFKRKLKDDVLMTNNTVQARDRGVATNLLWGGINWVFN